MPSDLPLSHNKCFPHSLPNNPNIMSEPLHSHPNQNLIIIGVKFHTVAVDHHKMELRQRPNTAKKVNSLNQSSTSSCYTALPDEHENSSENMPELTPVHIIFFFFFFFCESPSICELYRYSKITRGMKRSAQ
jgi:hypothetical protein